MDKFLDVFQPIIFESSCPRLIYKVKMQLKFQIISESKSFELVSQILLFDPYPLSIPTTINKLTHLTS